MICRDCNEEPCLCEPRYGARPTGYLRATRNGRPRVEQCELEWLAESMRQAGYEPALPAARAR
jgi:hypothetical protein